ncbi:hypothetical protein [Pseudarthrobacter sp. J1738]|uniref:hypothetical protein n=1 Tax=Pseudarthrobacter sp. J1738 TaxID=3420446 RepID=UPI003D2AFE19
MTSLARTWVDLASVLPLEDLVVAADFLINAHSDEFPVPREPLLSLEQLGAVVAERKGNRGVALAKRALDLARVGADSPPETLLRLRIVEAGLPEPDLNLVIRARTGNAVVWPDLGYKKYRISIQYDGAHHLGDEQQTWDLGRHTSTDRAGWTQVTVSDATIKRIGWDGVVREIRHRLVAKGWRPENP